MKKNKIIKEAPIDYEGPERMGSDVERKILSKTTPYSEHPAIPKDLDKDFIELISSKRFKDSVDKVRRYVGDTRVIQGQNAYQQLMSAGMSTLMQVMRAQAGNEEYLENLAVDLVKKELSIPEGALQFDAKLVSGALSKAEGMQSKPKMPSPEEIEDAFKEGEEHVEELENFVDSFEKFNLERAKRRFINSLIQGAAFKGGHMFVLVSDELNRLNPKLAELYGLNQALMEHLYWIYPEMESMVSMGMGQLGQSEVDEETDPPTVKARATTFPLLVHELVKGVYEVFGTHGAPDDPRQAEMVIGAEDTLPGEVWDSRFGPIFWEKFTEAYPDELFEDDKREIQNYLFVRFSRLNAEQFLRIAKLILAGDPKGKEFISKMVNEIISELKEREYEQSMSDDDDDDDDFDIDDISLKDLGL